MVLNGSPCRTVGGITSVIRLSPRTMAVPELHALGCSPIAEAEIRDMVEGPEGVVIVHGPPRAGGSLVLASLAALAARSHRKIMAIEPGGSTPYPPQVLRVPFTRREEMLPSWGDIVTGQGADVVLLDDLLLGDSIAETLSGASVGRLLFVRTDWLDGKSLVSFLARTRHGRAVFADRPFALLGLPTARRDGSRVWTSTEERSGGLSGTILTDEDRDRIANERQS